MCAAAHASMTYLKKVKYMTNCCNNYGECTQGRDCPIRKQRTKEANDAYINAQTPSLNRIWDNKEDRIWDDLIDDIADSFKDLIIVMAVVCSLTMLAFVLWGK